VTAPQRAILAAQATIGNRATTAAIESLRSPGSPLNAADQAYFEAAFGADLSGVRIHTGRDAAVSATREGASAYTVGRDVVFGAGRYAPGTRAGRLLLAHELAHVIQQRREGSGHEATAEADADQAARAAVAGQAAVVAAASGPGLARQAAIPSTADIQNLQDEDLEPELKSVRAWVLDPKNEANPKLAERKAYLARLESVFASRNPQHARRVRRQQTEARDVRVLSVVALPGIPHPEIIPFLQELAAGMDERIEQLPQERIARLVVRYGNMSAREKLRFAWGYIKGIGLGVWEEIKGIAELVTLPYKLIRWLVSSGANLIENWGSASGRAAEVLRLVGSAGQKAVEEIGKAIKDPAEMWRQLDRFFQAMVQSGLDKANQWGRQAADQVVEFFEQGTEEVGKGVGKIVGHILFNVLLLVATDAIGNLIKEGASLAGKLVSTVVAGVGEALAAIGRFVPKVIAALKWLGEQFLTFLKDTIALLRGALEALADLLKTLRPKAVAEAVGPGGVRITVPLEEEAGAASRALMSSAEGKVPRGSPTTTVEGLRGGATERIPTGGSKVETFEQEVKAAESKHPEAPRVRAERAEIGGELGETWKQRIGSDKVAEVRVKEIERTPYGRAQTEAVTPAGSTFAMEQEYVIKLRDGRTFQVDGMRPAGDGVLFQEHKTVETIWEQSYYSRAQARDKLRQMLINHRDIAFDLKPGCKGFFYTTNSPELRDLLTELIDSISPGERVLFPPE
jgi:hypothetical protein